MMDNDNEKIRPGCVYYLYKNQTIDIMRTSKGHRKTMESNWRTCERMWPVIIGLIIINVGIVVFCILTEIF